MMKKSIGSGRGSVYNVLLKALQSGDKYAYEICKEIEEKTNGAYVLKEQSSYSGLRRLEQRNEITSYWRESALGGRRHYYSLTEKGRQRLENSNFAWEDTRGEIVDNLFEQSEIDKQINNVSGELAQIKSSVEVKNQNEIDEIISKTESLVKENEQISQSEIEKNDLFENNEINTLNEQEDFFESDTENSTNNNDDNKVYDQEMVENYSHNETEKTNENLVNEQTDLFSIFADYSTYGNENKPEDAESYEKFDATNEHDESAEDESESGDNNEVFEENNNEPNAVDENSEKDEIQQDNTENENANVDDVEDITENNYSAEFVENVNEPEEAENDKYVDDLFDIANDNQSSEIKDSTETKDEELESANDQYTAKQNGNDADEPLMQDEDMPEISDKKPDNEQPKESFYEVIKNLTTVDEDNNSQIDNQTENFEQNNVAQQTLEQNNVDMDFYRQMYKSTNNYIDNTFEEKSAYNFFADYEDAKDSFEITDQSCDTANNQIVDDIDKNEQTINDDSQQTDAPHGAEQTSVYQNTKTIDYRDIFGDLVSKNADETISNFENKQTENFENDFEQSEFSGNDLKNEYEQQNNFENQAENNKNDFEIPSNSQSINDINRTLNFDNKSRIDEMYEMQSSYNNFEKNAENNYDDYYSYESDAIDTINNVSFDKKYDNLENKFEVPNYKIRYQQKPSHKRQSRFLLSNKLNLISNLMLCLLLAICNTITLLISKSLGSPNSQIVFCNVCYVVITAIILFNLAKYIINPSKRTHNLTKYDIIVSASLSAIILVLTFMINIWAGMTLSNISTYFASLVMPVFFAIALLLSHGAKKVLSKSSKFYK